MLGGLEFLIPKLWCGSSVNSEVEHDILWSEIDCQSVYHAGGKVSLAVYELIAYLCDG